MSGLEEEVAAWARSLGYRPTDAMLSRQSVSKLCRGTSRQFWEFVIQNFHAPEELKRLRAALARHEDAMQGQGGGSPAGQLHEQEVVRRLAQRQALLPKVQANNAMLKKSRDMHLKRYQEKVEESVRLESRSVGAQQTKEDLELQLHALKAYRERWEALVPVLTDQASRIGAARKWARGRVQAAAGSIAAADLATHLPRLAHQARLRLQEQVQQVWGVSLLPPDESQSGPNDKPLIGSGSGGTAAWAAENTAARGSDMDVGKCSGGLAVVVQEPGQQDGSLTGRCMEAGGEQQQAALGLLMRQQPQLVLATMAQMAQDSAQQLIASSPDLASASAAGGPLAVTLHGSGSQAMGTGLAVGGSPVNANPLKLLKQLQKAHLDRSLEAQAHHNACAELVDRMSLLLAEGQQLQGQLLVPLNKRRVQAAGQRARLAVLTAELRQLHSQCSTMAPVQQAMHHTFDALGSTRRLLGRLAQLIVQLSQEGAALVQGWGEQEETWATALHSYLPNICLAAAHNAVLAHDCIAGEVAAWQRLPCHTLVPAALHLPQGQHQGSWQHHPGTQQGQEGVGSSSVAGQGSMPLSACQLLALPLLPSLSSPLSSDGLDASQQAASQLSSVATKAGAAASISSASCGASAASSARLAQLLRGAKELDSAALIKCPYSLLHLVSCQQMQLRSLVCWLDKSAHVAEAPNRHLDKRYTQYRAVRKAMDGLWHEALHARLPQAEAALERLHQLRNYYDGAFHDAIKDCRELPAVGLLPEVKVEGCSATEWLQAIKDSHAMLRIAKEEQR